ncbi:hypothetical protein Plec18170_001350 [Paecilomyces lecythidis]
MKKGFECPGYSRPIKWYQRYAHSSSSETRTPREKACSIIWSKEPDNSEKPAQTTPAVSRKCLMNSDRRSLPHLWGHANEGEGLLERSEDFSTPVFDGDPLAEDGSEIFAKRVDDDHVDSLDMGDFWEIGTDSLNLILDPQESSAPIPSPRTICPDDQTTSLAKHYFSLICPINSCFDSPCNPFRSYIGELMLTCPLVFHCVMTMSAAHIGRREKSMAEVAIQHRDEAIAYLLPEISQNRSGNVKIEAILGSILLGVTSAWHDPSSLGLTHLNSGRTLFKRWIGDFHKTGNTRQHFVTDRNTSFLVGAMVYWEALMSFLTDGDLKSLEYISLFCKQQIGSVIYPNPWTGVSTPLFIYAAQAGVLSRQNRLARNLSSYVTSSAVRDEIYSKQLTEAARIERNVLEYEFPDRSLVDDTGDERTSVDDLETLGRIYRFVVLLQLYITFPDLLGRKDAPNSDLLISTSGLGPLSGSGNNTVPRMATVGLAATVLNLISSVPESSGIQVLLTLPLLVAGSALQGYAGNEDQGYNAGSLSIIEQEMLSLHSSRCMISHWRSFVRQRLTALYEYVGLDPIMRAGHILELVWTKADLTSSMAKGEANESSKSSSHIVHWIDTMVEERLESIFG